MMGGPCPVAVNPHMRSRSRQMRPDDRWRMHSWLSLVACLCDGTLQETQMLVREKQRRTTGRSCCLSPSVCKPGSMPSWQSVAIGMHWS